MKVPSKLLLDSNVWLDLFASNRPRRDDAVELVTYAVNQDISLLYAGSSIKDVYYLLEEREKKLLRAAGTEVTAAIAAAIDEYAWGCLHTMEEIATVVPLDQADIWLATKYRVIHDDFEDNLVLAAAERAKADFLVTSDAALLRKSPVAALSACDLMALMKA